LHGGRRHSHKVRVTTYHNDLARGGLIPAIGTSGIPVIDPSTDAPARPDIATLTEKFGGPVQITASSRTVT
jgi:hypothetical protein